MKDERKKLEAYLGRLETDFLKDSVKAVKEAGIIGGFDKIRDPIQVADNLATVIYTTENGSSFGFDTLYTAQFRDNVIVVNPLIRQR